MSERHMGTIILHTRDGRAIRPVQVPRQHPMPDALRSEGRLFVWVEKFQQYREAIVYDIPAVSDG